MDLNVPDRGWIERNDLAEVEGRITAFVRGMVSDTESEGVVVALSGGLDSSLSTALAAEALGPERVRALVLPADATPETNVADAREVAASLSVDCREIHIQGVIDGLVDAVAAGREVDPRVDHDANRVALGNVAARVRMAMTYFEANLTDRLVLGTTNRTELLLGYVTKYGNSASDLLPIGDLYKTEVRELARHRGLPRAILEKPPTAGMWEGQTDESELGADYETIDAILRRLVDEGDGIDATAEAVGLDRELVRRYAMTCVDAAHKRTPPPTPAGTR